MIFSNLSGGIDSVFGTYLWLKEGKEKLIIHHCIFDDGRGTYRTHFETEATYKSLEWYSRQGFSNFEYIESTLSLPKPENPAKRLLDLEAVMFITGGIFRANSKLTKLIRWANANDQKPTSKENIARLGALHHAARRKNIELIYPIIHLTKKEILEQIPNELLEISHSCRKPYEDGSDCMTCHSCKGIYAI